MTISLDLTEPDRPEFLRARSWIYALLIIALGVVVLASASISLALMLGVSVVAMLVPWMARPGRRLLSALVVDATVALVSWWLFGPIAGSDFVLFVVVALAGLSFESRRRNWIVGFAQVSELAQIPLHFIAIAAGGLPLFHPEVQVSNEAEFVGGVLLRFGVLALAAGLFAFVGAGLRASRAAVTRSEETFRGVFEEAPVGVAIVGKDGAVLRANRLITEVSGRRRAPRHISALFRAADTGRVEVALRAVLDGLKSSADLEVRTRTASGDRVFQVSTSGIALAGEKFAVLTAEDITERVEDHRRLEELVRSKDEFVASVSHELRTPLTAVLGFAEILGESWTGLSESEVEGLVNDIARESRDVAAIVEDLLVIARADIGKVTLLPEALGVAHEVGAVLAGFNESPISVDIPDDLIVYADPTRFRQILRNVISNAVRYGGKSVGVLAVPAGDNIEIVVHDDGSGVLGPNPDRIFLPYVSAHRTPTKPASVGLGLPVARSLARAMGGDLRYERDEGRTRFTIVIPATSPVSAAS